MVLLDAQQQHVKKKVSLYLRNTLEVSNTSTWSNSRVWDNVGDGFRDGANAIEDGNAYWGNVSANNNAYPCIIGLPIGGDLQTLCTNQTTSITLALSNQNSSSSIITANTRANILLTTNIPTVTNRTATKVRISVSGGNGTGLFSISNFDKVFTADAGQTNRLAGTFVYDILSLAKDNDILRIIKAEQDNTYAPAMLLLEVNTTK